MGRVRSRGGAVAGVFAAVAATTSGAGGAVPSAAPARVVFAVSLSGSITTTVTTAPDATARCRPTSELTVGRMVTFRSVRSPRVTVIRGPGRDDTARFARGRLSSVAGLVQVAAPSDYEVLCRDGSRAAVPANLYSGTSAWRGRVELALPSKGVIALRALHGAPEEPGSGCGRALSPPLGPDLAPGRIVQARLFRPRVGKLVARGSMQRTGQQTATCRVAESVEWELVLKRLPLRQ